MIWLHENLYFSYCKVGVKMQHSSYVVGVNHVVVVVVEMQYSFTAFDIWMFT